MKIYLYFLIENEIPYYVGLTTIPKRRYSKEKKKHLTIIEEYSDRVSANKSEMYWVEQLNAWGFKLNNKDLVPKKLSICKRNWMKNLIEVRVRITKEQIECLEYLEQRYGIPQSSLVRMALDSFLPKIKNSGFTEAGIRSGYLNGKY